MRRPLSLSRAQSVATALMPLVGVSAVLSGSVFWARRVGLLETERYWYPYRALVDSGKDRVGDLDLYLEVMRLGASLHELDGLLWLTKLLKQGVWLTLLLVAVSQVARVRQPRVFTAVYLGLFALAGSSALGAILHGRWIDLLAGGRMFGSWLLGACGTALASRDVLRALSLACVGALVVQGLLVPFELWRGLFIYSMSLGGAPVVRVVGTFNLPASLGLFAVITWTVALCWGAFSEKAMAWLTALVFAVLVFAASATAWVAFGAAAAVHVRGRLGERSRVAFMLIAMPLGLLVWLTLPSLTGRADIHDSLWGRIRPAHEYAAKYLSPSEVAFGHGFGLGTNAVSTLSNAPETTVVSGPDHPVGDSTPAALFWQVGLVGLALAYAACGLALRMDAVAQPIGVALLTASVAVNVTELFPVNLILGLWLAHAIYPPEVPG